MFSEDKVRLLESRYDINALQDPQKLVTHPVYLAAVVESRDDLVEAREDLAQKVAADSQDDIETNEERANLHRALSYCIDYYGYLRRKARGLLLDPPPGVRINEEEMSRREKTLNKYFPQSGSNFARQSVANQIESLKGLKSALSNDRDLQPLESTDFNQGVDAVVEANEGLQREITEDRESTRRLHASRIEFDQAHRSHMQQIESVLTRLDRSKEAGEFLKRRDAAYMSRRNAQAPIEDEPEAEEIDEEILDVTPVVEEDDVPAVI